VIHRIELYFLGFERRRGQLPTCFHADPTTPNPEREEEEENCDGASAAGPLRAYATPLTNRAAKGTAHEAQNPEMNDRDEPSCEGDHPRGPYTARRPFNPPGRVSDPGQDARLRMAPSLPSRTIAMS